MFGIFDSGLGGLTVLRAVRAGMPELDLVYLADQAHVPYGDRTNEDLSRLLAANVTYLEAAGVDAVVMGCNTSCAVAARYGWPDAQVPIFDLIETAAQAVVASGARRVGVVATAATVRSGAYGAAIRRLDPTRHVEEVATPALVPLVEAGRLTGAEAHDAIVAAHAAFAQPVDMLVLACTHYPLLDSRFAEVFGPDVARLDPALAQSARTVAFARAANAGGSGRTRYLTTGPLAPFRSALEAILGPLGPSDEVEALRPAGSAARSSETQ